MALSIPKHIKTDCLDMSGVDGPKIVSEDGTAVPVLTSYLEHDGLCLRSLAVPVIFSCSLCQQSRESTMVATAYRALVCPGCYAALAVPAQRTTENGR